MKSSELIPVTSAASVTTSAAFDLGDCTNYSIEVEITGTDVVGNLTLECRDLESSGWKTVTSSSQAISASSDHIWSVIGAGYRFVRVNWAYTSGTGNISSSIICKEFRIVGV